MFVSNVVMCVNDDWGRSSGLESRPAPLDNHLTERAHWDDRYNLNIYFLCKIEKSERHVCQLLLGELLYHVVLYFIMWSRL